MINYLEIVFYTTSEAFLSLECICLKSSHVAFAVSRNMIYLLTDSSMPFRSQVITEQSVQLLVAYVPSVLAGGQIEHVFVYFKISETVRRHKNTRNSGTIDWLKKFKFINKESKHLVLLLIFCFEDFSLICTITLKMPL